MNGIIDVYEKYFTDLTSFQFDLNKRKQHSCLACTSDIVNKKLSREAVEEFIINYLEHLKVFGYCLKLTEIFIKSVRENGILSTKVKGYWILKKHFIHNVFIIEHSTSRDSFEELLLLSKEKSKDKMEVRHFDVDDENITQSI